MALLAAPPPATISHLLADWLELAAFASASGRIPVEEINGALEIEEDSEPSEIHAEDDQREARVQAAISAIDERRKCMGGAYPFKLSPRGSLLILEADWTSAGSAAYLLCLVLSHVAKEGILSESSLPALEPARDLFQACATLCAAGTCRGPAFSFGWPRPDKSGFHRKLLEIFECFGDGTPRSTPPVGSPPRIKDGGIDVIAWSHEPDGLPGRSYLLGQVASGQNWKEKSVRPFIDQFHKVWFQRHPASTPDPAIFIPFCLSPPDAEAVDHVDQEEIHRNHVQYLTYLLGRIYYRYRIPRHASAAVDLATLGIGPIERLDSVADIAAWIGQVRESLMAEAR